MTNQDLHRLLAIDRSQLPSDGGPQYNRLIFANSPYLLQHAQNPVDWREWGDAAKDEATQRNLPLFVSIGFATCHWCHVMAHESFEDEKIAKILNHAFVPVKVDREERPDLDDFCMAACQALTGNGGWPLNCFLMPDGAPFYAITYLPKVSQQGRNGLLELLQNIARLWRHRPEAVLRNADAIMGALRRTTAPPLDDQPDNLTELASRAGTTLRQSYDHQYAGFGSAPKFPMPSYLLFLLERDDTTLNEMALQTLRAMRRGGIWDQLGGGIHRYSTDRYWLLPHFEKMLYDQALVAYTALTAYQLTGEDYFLAMADNLLEFVLRDLSAPQGGFYCGLDADTAASEGGCYLWSKHELERILGKEAAVFCERYGVTETGNVALQGKNILHHAITIDELTRRYGRNETELTIQLNQCVHRLVKIRNRREQPLKDKKIITAWNGLTIAALARGGAITGNRHWQDAARQAVAFINERLVLPDGRLLRSYLVGPSPVRGFLEDYAYLAWGHIELYQATREPADLTRAQRLCSDALRLFSGADGQLRTAGSDAEQMPFAVPVLRDGALLSGASVMATCLVQLAVITDDRRWSEAAQTLLTAYHSNLQTAPMNSLHLLQAGCQLHEQTFPSFLKNNRNIIIN